MVITILRFSRFNIKLIYALQNAKIQQNKHD